MAKFTPTSKVNPCPICSKTNGNCRIVNEKLVLCMTFADTWETHINGHKHIGKSSDGSWGKFILEDPDSDYSKERQEQYQAYKEAQEKARQEQFKGSLSVQERDKAIRTIIKTFGLTHEHEQEMLNRGLTKEQIIEGKFCTIKPFSELPLSVSTRLAGVYVGRNGYPTIGSNFQQGILCPIFNQDGLITGYQIMRTERSKDDGNKYVWGCTSEKDDRKKISSHLPTGELPINYWLSPEKNNRTLWLNDGNLKTYIAHCLHDIDIVGCAGGNFLSSFNQLLNIAKNYDYLIYALDGGDILNRSVMNRVTKLAKALKEKGIELNFAYWGQLTKNGNDIDEINELTYITLNLEELLELANKEQFNAKKRGNLENFTNFTPNTTINERYVSDYLLKIDIEGKITATQSALNTGKTYYLQELARATNHPIIMIGTRQILTCTSAGQLNIMYADRNLPEDVVQAIMDSPQDYERRLAIVVDSLLKLKNSDWQDAIVVVDEAEQFPEHLLLAKTHINKVRARVLALLAEKLPMAKGLLLFDGHLSDFTCDYFAQMSGLPLQKIKNTYQENHRNLYWYEDKDNLTSLIEQGQKDNENLLVLGDSAKELTAMFELDKESGKKSVLLTRENIADNPKLSRFLENNGRAIRDEGIKTVYLSPVAQSGVSIEIDNYFNKVYGLINGVIGTNVTRQILIRDRSNADRHIWCAERGLGYTTDYEIENIKASQEFQEEQLIESIRYFQEKEGLNFIDALGKVTELRKVNQKCKDINEDARASLIAKNNIVKSDYRAILRDELIEDNYNLIEVGEADFWGKLAQIKEKKEELTINQANRVFSAPEIDEKEADKLSNKDGLKESERDKLLKYRIQQFLPNFELNPEFILTYILKDRWNSLKSIVNLVLARMPEVAQKLDFNVLHYVLHQANDKGLYWGHDIKLTQPLADIFRELDIENFIKSGKITQSEEIELRNKCKNHRRKLRQFNIKFSHKTSDSYLLRLIFNLFGYRCHKDRKADFWHVKPVLENELFNDIYLAISQRYSQEFEVKYDTIQQLLTKTAEPQLNKDFNLNIVPDDNNNYTLTPMSTSNSINISISEDKAESHCHTKTIENEIQINNNNKNQQNLSFELDQLTNSIRVGEKFKIKNSEAIYQVFRIYEDELNPEVHAFCDGSDLPSFFNFFYLINNLGMEKILDY